MRTVNPVRLLTFSRGGFFDRLPQTTTIWFGALLLGVGWQSAIVFGGTPPSVTITDVSRFPGKFVVINATASSDGQITKVEFFAGTNFLGVDLDSPYSLIWSNAPAGRYQITAKATDDSDLFTIATGWDIVVNNPPTVELIEPAADSAFTAGASVRVVAEPHDTDGSIASVELWLFDQTAQSSVRMTNAPYQFTFTNLSEGDHVIRVDVVDDLGFWGERAVQIHTLPRSGLPLITVEPQSRCVEIGADVSFSVLAASQLPVGYQWLANGAELPGATNSSLDIRNAQTTDNGFYSVVVSNSVGAVSGNTAFLLVSTEPISNSGGTVSFASLGSSPNDSFGVVNPPGRYRVELTDPKLTGDQWAAQLYASQGGQWYDQNSYKPVGLPEPLQRGLWAGYFIADTPRHIPFVQPGSNAWVEARIWSVHYGDTFAQASSVDGATCNRGGLIYCPVTGVDGDPIKPPAMLIGMFPYYVEPYPIGGGSYAWNDLTNRTVFAGSSVGFHIGVQTCPWDGSTMSLICFTNKTSIQWRKNGVPIPDGTNAVLRLVNVQPADAAMYSVAFFNRAGVQLDGTGGYGMWEEIPSARLTVLRIPAFDQPAYSEGRLHSTLSGYMGHQVTIQVSNDMQTWIPIMSATNAPGTLAVDFGLLDNSDSSIRFYRAMVEP